MRGRLIFTTITLLWLLTCHARATFGQTDGGRNSDAAREKVRTAVDPVTGDVRVESVSGEQERKSIPVETRQALPIASLRQPLETKGKDATSQKPPLDYSRPGQVNAPTNESSTQTSPLAAAQTTPASPAASDETLNGPGNGSLQDSPAEEPMPKLNECKIADIVALDQAFFYNRYGAINPAGMIYALRRDVEPIVAAKGLVEGNVRLRSGKHAKRARPIVLRMNIGDCLRVEFQNLLSPAPKDDQPYTRATSVHVQGLQLVNSIQDDGSFVGKNPSSLVLPGGKASYTFYATREGGYVLYSTGATTGGEGDGGSLAFGLFGSVNVEPRDSEWYRSQVTEEDIRLATKGRARTGQPLIDYDARYPPGHQFAGIPILNMRDGNRIVHTDLNAIITYKDRKPFPRDLYPRVAVSPDRHQPFREHTIIYHDEIKAMQAFPEFFDERRNPVMAHTLHSVRDAFAINYGTGGIGAEILANRLKLGPVRRCDECLFEEFFLSSWSVGDPAMIVDKPANSRRPATQAFFPEDPTNVYHSYLNDHVKFRVMHAGPKEHHIHHLHAHQWLHTPDSDTSTMLDSQAIGPGSSFTTEIVHGGAGNRGKTPGDAIFHCHFYPHFAQGMWALMRVHDVFEEGTPLDSSGRPARGARALPDGEISAGTPIPAIVPLPTRPMAPMPGADVQIVNGQVSITSRCEKDKICNPGYPFFIPSQAGHRPPHPPLDTEWDGGLPRHRILSATFVEQHNRHNFDKSLKTAVAEQIPEGGTPDEQEAMEFHAREEHRSSTPENDPANFKTNGLPAKPGAPYADPCREDDGDPVKRERLYKAAVFQTDVIFNKAGWHFPQQRISALWEDVIPMMSRMRPPEPLFFRANTNDCVVFKLTNLVPRVYELDDFQVRTPTDVMGQHIHLVKFDVTSSDGGGNGFNYEDGSFAPEEVRERIHAINRTGGLRPFGQTGAPVKLHAKKHPFDKFDRPEWRGAQITVQRWFADDVLDNEGNDRTQRTAFTHDHFGPSTHQQVGQYAGLVVEPEGSTWHDPEKCVRDCGGKNPVGEQYGTRHDGGPTSWRADIRTKDPNESYREFLIEFTDFQHAYRAGGGVHPVTGRPKPDPVNAINPPAKKEAPFRPPFVLLQKMRQCPGGVPLPCPEAIAAADVGTMVINYRNEPIPHRIWNFDGKGPEPRNPTQAPDPQGDLANVYRSDMARKDQRYNVQPNFYPPLTNEVYPCDPFTPLLRAYGDDPVQIRVLVGAHEEGHNFSVNGLKWLFEPSFPDSGYRNSQMMGISEHFEFVVPVLPLPERARALTDAQACPQPDSPSTAIYDFRYAPGTAVDDQWNGLWGILRASPKPTQGVKALTGEANERPPLIPLPSNPVGREETLSERERGQVAVCPVDAPQVSFDVTAGMARDLLRERTLVYNPRGNLGGRLEDPTAIVYVRTEDIDPATKRLRAPLKAEPLILRANAGDCINVTLRNQIRSLIDQPGFNTLPMIIDNFNANQIRPSDKVGLHAQLMFYDVRSSDGMNVGFNFKQTASPGETVNYRWYAGEFGNDCRLRGRKKGRKQDSCKDEKPRHFRVEFGSAGLMPADPIKHSNKGAVGALIIEPYGTTVSEPDGSTHAVADIMRDARPVFREFVLIFQNDINMRYGSRKDPWGNLEAVRNLAREDDAEDSGQKAFNYRTEPLWKRMGYKPETPLEQTRRFNFQRVLSNSQIGGVDPVTPVFTAAASDYVRFRVLHPGGHARNNVFVLHGHSWQELPYINKSTEIGDNRLSEVKGFRSGIGPSEHFDVDLRIRAGGRFRVRGDYLYRDQASFTFDGGLWGIFRVQ